MIAKQRAAMQMALEALEEATTYTASTVWSPSMTKECEKAATALREALEVRSGGIEVNHGLIQIGSGGMAQPQGDDKSHNAPPEDWNKRDKDELLQLEVKRLKQLIAAEAQPQGEWVDLTKAEIWDIREPGYLTFADALIAKFKKKNTPPVVPQGEPVAWVNVIDSDNGPYDFHGLEKLPKGKHHLYTTPLVVLQGEPDGWALKHKNGLEFNAGYGMVKTLQEAEDMQRRHLGDISIVALYTTQQSVEAMRIETLEKAALACEEFQDKACGMLMADIIRSMK